MIMHKLSVQRFSFSRTFCRHILQIFTQFTDRGVGKNIIVQQLGCIWGWELFQIVAYYLHSLPANDFGKFLFTTVQSELFKNRVSEK